MSEYTANMELVQDKPVQDDAHVATVLKTGNNAAAYLSAYKARRGEAASEYGSAIWWVASGVLLILAAIAVQVLA